MISALLATKTMEDISVASGNGLRWLQIYMYRDRQLVTDIVHRAELAGYKAIVVTIDSPTVYPFNALRDVFKLPSHIGFANFRGATVASNVSLNDTAKLTTSLRNLLDPSLCWDDIRWLCSITHLPIVVKGVLTAEDAESAVESGVAGILVSNHGGRLLNTAVATVSDTARGVVRLYLYVHYTVCVFSPLASLTLSSLPSPLPSPSHSPLPLPPPPFVDRCPT